MQSWLNLRMGNQQTHSADCVYIFTYLSSIFLLLELKLQWIKDHACTANPVLVSILSGTALVAVCLGYLSLCKGLSYCCAGHCGIIYEV